VSILDAACGGTLTTVGCYRFGPVRALGAATARFRQLCGGIRAGPRGTKLQFRLLAQTGTRACARISALPTTWPRPVRAGPFPYRSRSKLGGTRFQDSSRGRIPPISAPRLASRLLSKVRKAPSPQRSLSHARTVRLALNFFTSSQAPRVDNFDKSG